MTYSESFIEFWCSYPRKDAKADAFKAWKKLDPDAALQQEIHAALVWQKGTRQWKDRTYIPLPATWLRGRRWEDEKPEWMQPRQAEEPQQDEPWPYVCEGCAAKLKGGSWCDSCWRERFRSGGHEAHAG